MINLVLNEEMLSLVKLNVNKISFMMIINATIYSKISIQNHTGDWGNQYVLVDQSVYL